jgi:hypothetical protein
MSIDSSEKQSFLVQAEDGRKFKMVIRGDLAKIPVEKIKRYLKSYGVPDGQSLSYEGMLLTDDMFGGDFGLTTNSVLKLHSTVQQQQQTPQHYSSSSRGLAVDVEGRQRQLAFEEERRQQQSAAAAPSSSAHHSSNIPEWPRRSAPGAPFGGSPAPSAAPFGTPHVNHHSSGVTGGSTELWASSSHIAAASEHPLQRQVANMDSENQKLRREVESLKLELEAKRAFGPAESLLASAKANLHELGKELGMHLVLDQNLSCVIGNDETHTIIITFDAPTERLYVYSTLLTFIPQDPQVRLQLFEILLDGALLGRDVAGGGIGASMQSGVVMMSTSILLRHCGPGALREVVPAFVEALVRWRAIVAETVGLE